MFQRTAFEPRTAFEQWKAFERLSSRRTFLFRLGLKFVFKSSFDKTNRTSSKSFRGPGMYEGLKILERVKTIYDVPVVTDVHESIQCEAVGRVVDIIQIPAFLCRQVSTPLVHIQKYWSCAYSLIHRPFKE
ncbi:unnamed protein product [Cuscuta europaea]|uniref:3-deoxy-8-phosphooctulonate synthase n=1 Tax=Cuscuta europaea TaxID=41803 RepID=A0A9P0YTL0_CUSEU|nr:unnamed protein product [Cuscuta europaea]